MVSSNGQNSSQCVCVNWVTVSEMHRIDRNIDKLRDRNAERLFRLRHLTIFSMCLCVFDVVSVYLCRCFVYSALLSLVFSFKRDLSTLKRDLSTLKRDLATLRRDLSMLSTGTRLHASMFFSMRLCQLTTERENVVD